MTICITIQLTRKKTSSYYLILDDSYTFHTVVKLGNFGEKRQMNKAK